MIGEDVQSKFDQQQTVLLFIYFLSIYRKKFRSATEVYIHTCNVHCPDNIDLSNAEIYCQWGPGSTLCDNLPRKRFSLMTHLFDRHCTLEVKKKLFFSKYNNQ